MPDVSIVIVNWNTRQVLLDALRSLEQTQSGANWEIIVVDNASSDGSPDAVESQFPNVRLFRNDDNLGFARANNVGMRESSGRYVALVNSDVIVLDDCLQNLTAFMDAHPDIAVAGPRVLNLDRTLQPSCRTAPTYLNSFLRTLALDALFPKSSHLSGSHMAYWPHDTQRDVDGVSGCCMFVRKKAIDQVGLLDDKFFMYGEDVDWCKRFRDAGWRVVFTPTAQLIHLGGASSANAPARFYVEMQKAQLYFWRKHHGRFGSVYYCLLILMHQLLRLFPRAVQYAVFPAKRSAIRPKLQRSMACIRWLFGSRNPVRA